MGAIDAAALGPFKKLAHGHGRENEKSLLYFGRDLSGWYNFGNIIKIVATRCHLFYSRNAPNSISEKLTALPQPLTGFKGPASNGKEGR